MVFVEAHFTFQGCLPLSEAVLEFTQQHSSSAETDRNTEETLDQVCIPAEAFSPENKDNREEADVPGKGLSLISTQV